MGSSFLLYLQLSQLWCFQCLPRAATLPLAFRCMSMTALPGMCCSPGSRDKELTGLSFQLHHDGLPRGLSRKDSSCARWAAAPCLTFVLRDIWSRVGMQTGPRGSWASLGRHSGRPVTVLLFRSKHLPVFKQYNPPGSCPSQCRQPTVVSKSQ